MISGTSGADDPTLHLPRILCLHGGGTNARIFRAQCRVLERMLRPTFRLCYAEAPYPSQAGTDVTSVYKDFGPFRAWLRWMPEDAERDAESAVEQIEESLRHAMFADDQQGATGEFVALLGFSQGAKLCASLLFAQQLRSTASKTLSAKPPISRFPPFSFRFAVLLAGRGPLVSMTPELAVVPGLVDASCISTAIPNDKEMHRPAPMKEHLLRLPTIHVHGMRDPGIELHRKLLHQYCDVTTTTLIEWEGEHRVPIKTRDVTDVVEAIMAISRATYVFD